MVNLLWPTLRAWLIDPDEEPLLHMLHLGGNPLIRTIRIRPPSPKCIACAGIPLKVEEFDYEAFCSGAADVGEQEGLSIGNPEERISVEVSRHQAVIVGTC